MKNWLKKRREMRALKKRWLREFRGGRVVVLSTEMAVDYDPPSSSLSGA